MDCDRCCAHALTGWWRPDGRLELWLCGHHANEHAAALHAQRFRLVIDERDMVLPLPDRAPGPLDGRLVRDQG